MRDFPILPILLILYVIAVAGGRKKKANKQGGQRKRHARADARTRTREEGARERTEQTAQEVSAAFARERSAPVPEGEDSCHPAPKREQPQADLQEHEPEQVTEPSAEPNALAQDVLRGVIMSEILTRPCERRVRNRRGYHG